MSMDVTTVVRRSFAPARRPGRIGVEVELIPVTDDARPAPVDPRVLAGMLDDPLVRDARLSLEPGGQLELSPAPDRIEPLLATLAGLLRRVRELAADRGVRLLAIGTNPYHSCAQVPLRLPTPRYLAMQRAFDRIGLDGRRMMRLTASLQIAVDLLPGRAGREQWLVANLAGPALAAAFANSPWLDGRRAAIPGARTRIWQRVDLSRTAYDGRHLDLVDPVGGYAAFVSAADPLPIPGGYSPEYHLTTVFPPVRPRGGYLEIRYLDAQPVERIGEVVRAVARLLYDDEVRHAALELLLPRSADLAAAWDEAAAGECPESAELMNILRGRDRVASRWWQAGAA